VLAVWDPSARDIPISDKVRRHAEPQVDWLFLELELLWLPSGALRLYEVS
jgi:hypothetical protein